MTNIHAQLEVKFPRLDYTLYGQGPEGKIESAHFESDFLVATDGFSITFRDDDANFWPEAQPVEIYLDGALQILGRVDRVTRGGGSHTATIAGRDYLADLTECDVDASFLAKEGMTLEQALLSVLSPCGITQIDTPIQRNATRSKNRPGDASAADIRKKKLTARQVKDLRPKPGEKAFAYANKLVVRSGATIQPALRRNAIVVQGPTYDDSLPRPKIISRIGNPDNANNAEKPESVRNWSAVPTYLMCANQTKRTMDVGTARNKFQWDMVKRAADFFDVTKAEFKSILGIMLQGRILPGQSRAQSLEGGDLYRLRYVRDVKSRTQEQLDGFGFRTLANALQETLTYTATMRGVTDPNTGLIWSVDSQVDVEDDINRVWEKLWISGKSIDWATSGASTQIRALRPKTFQLEIPDE